MELTNNRSADRLFNSAQLDRRESATLRQTTHGGLMSAHNGQRARFHRNRKRRVVQRMRLRAALLTITEQKAAPAAHAALPTRRGPALVGN